MARLPRLSPTPTKKRVRFAASFDHRRSPRYRVVIPRVCSHHHPGPSPRGCNSAQSRPLRSHLIHYHISECGGGSVPSSEDEQGVGSAPLRGPCRRFLRGGATACAAASRTLTRPAMRRASAPAAPPARASPPPPEKGSGPVVAVDATAVWSRSTPTSVGVLGVTRPLERARPSAGFRGQANDGRGETGVSLSEGVFPFATTKPFLRFWACFKKTSFRCASDLRRGAGGSCVVHPSSTPCRA